MVADLDRAVREERAGTQEAVHLSRIRRGEVEGGCHAAALFDESGRGPAAVRVRFGAVEPGDVVGVGA